MMDMPLSSNMLYTQLFELIEDYTPYDIPFVESTPETFNRCIYMQIVYREKNKIIEEYALNIVPPYFAFLRMDVSWTSIKSGIIPLNKLNVKGRLGGIYMPWALNYKMNYGDIRISKYTANVKVARYQ